MRPGPLEFILIIVVIVAVVIIARIVRTGSRSSAGASSRRGTEKGWARNLFNRSGIVLVIAGILGLAIAASFFRLMLQS
jgi:hypothetical protein